MSKIKSNAEDIFLLFLFYCLSIFFMPLYIGGDQEFYRRVYENVATNNSLLSSYTYYTSGLGATEIVHFLLILISSEFGISKDIIMSSFNSLLYFFAYKLCCKLGAYKLVSFVIVISNYYLYVMAFSAERLKFGFVFLFAFLLYQNRLFLFLSLLSHFQIALIFISSLASKVSTPCKRLFFNAKIRKIHLFYFSIFVSLSSLIVYFSNVAEKILIYLNGSDFTVFSLLKVLVLFLISMISMSSKNRIIAFPQLFILLFSAVLLGTDRVFVVMYFVAMYYCIQYKRGLNLFVFFTVLYYSVSSLTFLSNILIYGDGFNL